MDFGHRDRLEEMPHGAPTTSIPIHLPQLSSITRTQADLSMMRNSRDRANDVMYARMAYGEQGEDSQEQASHLSLDTHSLPMVSPEYTGEMLMCTDEGVSLDANAEEHHVRAHVHHQQHLPPMHHHVHETHARQPLAPRANERESISHQPLSSSGNAPPEKETVTVTLSLSNPVAVSQWMDQMGLGAHTHALQALGYDRLSSCARMPDNHMSMLKMPPGHLAVFQEACAALGRAMGLKEKSRNYPSKRLPPTCTNCHRLKVQSMNRKPHSCTVEDKCISYSTCPTLYLKGHPEEKAKRKEANRDGDSRKRRADQAGLVSSTSRKRRAHGVLGWEEWLHVRMERGKIEHPRRFDVRPGTEAHAQLLLSLSDEYEHERLLTQQQRRKRSVSVSTARGRQQRSRDVNREEDLERESVTHASQSIYEGSVQRDRFNGTETDEGMRISSESPMFAVSSH